MLDEKDQKILDILHKNAKLSTQQISRKTLIPITTVHNRIKKLEKSGIITGYGVRVDHTKLEKGLSAYILVTVDYPEMKKSKLTQKKIAKMFMRFSSVDEACILTGGADIIIRVRVKDIQDLDGFITTEIRNIAGVEKTQTMIVLHEL